MTAREQHLLALAVEAAPLHELSIWQDGPKWHAEAGSSDAPIGQGPTIAAALEALLDDLGVGVPPEPTAESRCPQCHGYGLVTVGGWQNDGHGRQETYTYRDTCSACAGSGVAPEPGADIIAYLRLDEGGEA